MKNCSTFIIYSSFLLLLGRIVYTQRIICGRPVVTDVARNVVCVSVCWSHWCTVQKQLNRSRSRLRDWLLWAEGTIIKWSRDDPREGFLGVPAQLKTLWVCAAVYAAKRIIQSSITARHAMRPFVKILWPLVISHNNRPLPTTMKICRFVVNYCPVVTKQVYSFLAPFFRTKIGPDRTHKKWKIDPTRQSP